MSAQPLVVIVEDDDEVRLTLRDFLVSRGYDVEVASDGVGAIRLLIDHDVSAIVTDYRMDLLGGAYWMRFLKRFLPGMPIFVVSGFLDPDFEVPFPALPKPIDFDALEELIRESLTDDSA
jgi:DNA-binding NtrC family response regulator